MSTISPEMMQDISPLTLTKSSGNSASQNQSFNLNLNPANSNVAQPAANEIAQQTQQLSDRNSVNQAVQNLPQTSAATGGLILAPGAVVNQPHYQQSSYLSDNLSSNYSQLQRQQQQQQQQPQTRPLIQTGPIPINANRQNQPIINQQYSYHGIPIQRQQVKASSLPQQSQLDYINANYSNLTAATKLTNNPHQANMYLKGNQQNVNYYQQQQRQQQHQIHQHAQQHQNQVQVSQYHHNAHNQKAHQPLQVQTNMMTRQGQNLQNLIHHQHNLAQPIIIHAPKPNISSLHQHHNANISTTTATAIHSGHDAAIRLHPESNRERSVQETPLYKLSVSLIDTYRQINIKYYDAKKARRNRQRYQAQTNNNNNQQPNQNQSSQASSSQNQDSAAATTDGLNSRELSSQDDLTSQDLMSNTNFNTTQSNVTTASTSQENLSNISTTDPTRIHGNLNLPGNAIYGSSGQPINEPKIYQINQEQQQQQQINLSQNQQLIYGSNVISRQQQENELRIRQMQQLQSQQPAVNVTASGKFQNSARLGYKNQQAGYGLGLLIFWRGLRFIKDFS